ncbi:MAG: hypothetical protein DWP92_11200 [Armatimonadetes bacterium]|nr:MAG: hypothetical protein DWP92_11200 [Armatimonadota bacterium]
MIEGPLLIARAAGNTRSAPGSFFGACDSIEIVDVVADIEPRVDVVLDDCDVPIAIVRDIRVEEVSISSKVLGPPITRDSVESVQIGIISGSRAVLQPKDVRYVVGHADNSALAKVVVCTERRRAVLHFCDAADVIVVAVRGFVRVRDDVS